MAKKGIEWFIGHIEPLLKIGSDFDALFPGEYYEPREWAVTKLVALNYYLTMYTRIIKNNFSGKMRYLDLMSGTGLCRIRQTEHVIAGSALIAAHTKIPFDDHIFVDKNKKSIQDLERRMDYTGRAYQTIHDDCNKCIENIVSEFEDGDHYLAFIDNLGLDVNWKAIETLLEYDGDLIINFQTNGVERVRGRARKSVGDRETLTRFYGCDVWENCDSGAELLGSYMGLIQGVSNRKNIVPIHVQGVGGFRYDLLLATKETPGGNPWLIPMREIGDLFKEYGHEYVKIALQRAAGVQAGLERWMG